MTLRWKATLPLGLIAVSAGACGEQEASNLTYAEVRDAAQGKDAAAYRSYFRDVKGQRIAWSGQVVEVKTEHGDEFVEVSALVVDLDDAAPKEDAVFQVSASTAEARAPGREEKFTGSLQDFEWTNQRPLLRLDVQDVE